MITPTQLEALEKIFARPWIVDGRMEWRIPAWLTHLREKAGLPIEKTPPFYICKELLP